MLPAQMLVEARLPSHALDNPAAEAAGRLDALLAGLDCRGQRIAVGAGSRGIDRIAEVVGAVVATLKARGARPFIVPAMGSHGGGNAEGQVELLDSFGISEATMGAPLRPSMEVVEIGRTPLGEPVFTAREALEADGVVLINRVKPHTDFESVRVGSGLVKMTAIGLGKVEGAAAAHRAARRHGYEESITAAARVVRARLKLLAGVALLEDAHHRLARVEVVPAAEIEAREPALLAQARSWMPSLPFPEVDILILDEIGKNISGAGMDTNVVGRGVDGLPFRSARSRAKNIYVRGLTPESHGNAVGVGLAEVVRSQIIKDMDSHAMYTNALSAMTPATVRVPMHFDTDAECLKAVLRVAGADADKARIVRVRNTLAVDRFVASEAYAAEVAERDDLTVLIPPRPWTLDAQGNFDAASDLLATASA
jgi:uncharacterized protein DUF362